MENNINDYFETTYSGTSPDNWVRDNLLKKVPDLVIDDSVTSLRYICSYTTINPKIICNSNITNMSNMFYQAYSLTNVSAIDDWDVRTVTATAGSSSSSSNKFYNMFNGAPTHPNFTKRAGTWNSNGTFIPSS